MEIHSRRIHTQKDRDGDGNREKNKYENSKRRPQSDISNQINALFSIKTTQQCCTDRWQNMCMGDKWDRARSICHFTCEAKRAAKQQTQKANQRSERKKNAI